MNVLALKAEVINLAAILQHKYIPLSLRGNGRKDQTQKQQKRKKNNNRVQTKRVYEKAE